MPTPPNTTVEEQVKDWNEKFHKKFGNVYDYEMEHTIWWVEQLSHQHSQLKEAVEGMKMNEDDEILFNKIPEHSITNVYTMPTWGYNKAIKDILEVFLTNKEEGRR